MYSHVKHAATRHEISLQFEGEKYGGSNRLWQQPETSLKPEGPRAHARSMRFSGDHIRINLNEKYHAFASIRMKNTRKCAKNPSH